MGQPTVLSLCTGIGGLDVGLEAAGYKVIAAVEKDRQARTVLQKLQPSWELLEQGDLCQLKAEHLRLHVGKREVDVLAGGPPCQPFSHAASWARPQSAFDDDRADAVRAYFRVARWTTPRVLLLESVPGLANHHMKRLHAFLGAINQKCGTEYRWHVLRLHAADWGIPQLRRRTVLLAHREGADFTLPPPTHGQIATASTKPWTTAWDALGDIEASADTTLLAPSGRWAALLPSVPEGKNYLHFTARGDGGSLFGWRTRYWAFLLKLAKNMPSWTLSATPGPSHGPFHWANRRLSELEMAAIQTYPLKRELGVTPNVARRLLGNAVPSALGEMLGRQVARQWLGKSWSTELTLIPEHRDDCPSAASTQPLPAQFWKLLGEHAEHPGHGLGPGAAARKAVADRLKKAAH